MNADYSNERRTTAVSWLRKYIVDDPEMDESAALMSAIGLVICDDRGFVNADHLDEAITDPSIVNYARQLLAEAEESD